ncbi:MAG: aspartate aminotransferase family protein, partial [Acidimicrobiia bacterium]|nr:aspartate aminotransferase family protein [Acidimicrobiia bacterium]
QELAAWARADDRFEVVAPHPLNLVCLRITGDSPEDGDVRTDALIEAANATGQALFTRTVLDGRSVLRFSIGGRTTERRHVEAAWGLLAERA